MARWTEEYDWRVRGPDGVVHWTMSEGTSPRIGTQCGNMLAQLMELRDTPWALQFKSVLDEPVTCMGCIVAGPYKVVMDDEYYDSGDDDDERYTDPDDD